MGTENIQAPLHFVTVKLQLFSKIKRFILFLLDVRSAPHLTENRNLEFFVNLLKKNNCHITYHMVISIKTLCIDTHI